MLDNGLQYVCIDDSIIKYISYDYASGWSSLLFSVLHAYNPRYVW